MTFRGNGDRRFNDWHYSLPRDWWYIDLDGMEVCSRCRRPLLLYEVTRDPQKATTILSRLSQAADIPAVLMLLPDGDEPLADDTVVRWRLLGAREWSHASLLGWKDHLAHLRAAHDASAHTTAAVA